MSEPALDLKTKLVGILLAPLSWGVAEAQILEPSSPPERLEPSSDLVPETIEEAIVRSIPDAEPARPAPDSAERFSTIHLASYYTNVDAVSGWGVLLDRHERLLDGLEPRAVEVDLGDRGIFVRLLAGPLRDPAEASELCELLRDEGAYCVPADGAGKFLVPDEGFGG